MDYLRIKKENINQVYIVTFLYDKPVEKQTGGQYPKTEYNHTVLLNGQQVILQASAALNGQIKYSQCVKGDTAEIKMVQGEGAGILWNVVKRVNPAGTQSQGAQSNGGQSNGGQPPDWDAIRDQKQSDIHRQGALKLAVESVGKLPLETWNQAVEEELLMRAKWFLYALEGNKTKHPQPEEQPPPPEQASQEPSEEHLPSDPDLPF